MDTLYNREREIKTFNEGEGKPAEFEDYLNEDREDFIRQLQELIDRSRKELGE